MSFATGHSRALIQGLIFFSVLAGASLQAQFYGKAVFEVSTAEEFVAAVGSDRTIKLNSGLLVPSDSKSREHPHVSWSKRGQNRLAVIRNVRNLRIMASTSLKSALQSGPGHSQVLGFENVVNLELRGLRITAAEGARSGNLLSFTGCTNILLRGCELQGERSRAVEIRRCARFSARETKFLGCAYGVVSVGDSRNLLFRQSNFIGNRGEVGLQLHRTYDARFTDCELRGNRFSKAVFDVLDSAKIRWVGGKIEQPGGQTFCHQTGAVAVEKKEAD